MSFFANHLNQNVMASEAGNSSDFMSDLIKASTDFAVGGDCDGKEEKRANGTAIIF